MHDRFDSTSDQYNSLYSQNKGEKSHDRINRCKESMKNLTSIHNKNSQKLGIEENFLILLKNIYLKKNV